MKQTAALFAILVANSTMTANAQQTTTTPYVPPPAKELVAFIQTSGAFSPAERKRIFDGYLELLHQQKTYTPNPFLFRGEPVTVHPTPHPVRDHAPPCGELEAATLDGDARLLVDALSKGGLVTMLSYPVAGASAMLLGAAIGAVAPKRINYSHCRAACVLIPAKIDSKVIEDYGYVVLEYSTPSAPIYNSSHAMKKPFSGLIDLHWAAWDAPSFTTAPVPGSAFVLPSDHPARNAQLDNGQGCESTLVCGRLRNWSDTWIRSAQIGVGLQPGPWVKNSCLDVSVIESVVQESLVIPALSRKDMLGLALKRYSEALLQQPPQPKLP